jgi:hypothetical protein
VMGNLVHNERIKLRAAFFNNIGVAAFVTGIIVPGMSNIGKGSAAIPRRGRGVR